MKKKLNYEKMTLFDHIRELRKRLIITIISIILTSILCFIFSDLIINLLFYPFRQIDTLSSDKSLYINAVFEGFVIKIKIAIAAGLILALPILIYQILRFVFPGLNKGEQRVILYSLIASSLLLPLGFYYGYYLIIPLSIQFLTSEGFIPSDVGILLNYSQNIFIILQFIMAFIIVFQLPIVLILLMKMNVVSCKFLFSSSRFFIVGMFALSAIITPPDVVSQISVALPLILLFFAALLIGKIFRLGEESEIEDK